ncbi:MAG: VTT domain-containing protein [Desulfurococcales archaeon]|nr:VTT domain-containing protein [Desulfurococcales archaeon]
MDISSISGIFHNVESLGILGIFIVALLSNILPYLTVPYLVVISLYAASTGDVFDKIAVGLAGGLGAGLGKTILFFLFRTGRKLISVEKREQLTKFADMFQRGIFLALLLFAATPLPDDVFYIPLSVTGYSILRFFIAVTLGKTVITSLSVAFGSSLSILTGETSIMSPEIILATIIATLIITYVVVKMDWDRVIIVYKKKGFIWAIIEVLFQSTVIILFFLKPLYNKYSKYVNKT